MPPCLLAEISEALAGKGRGDDHRTKPVFVPGYRRLSSTEAIMIRPDLLRIKGATQSSRKALR